MTSRKGVETLNPDMEFKLMKEFGRVKELLGIAGLTGVVWKPGHSRSLSGEVRNAKVFIYEADEDKALETLRHEMIDYQITSKLIQPLIDVINSLMKLRETDIYKQKEKIVEQLSKLLR